MVGPCQRSKARKDNWAALRDVELMVTGDKSLSSSVILILPELD